jgi:predicted nucleic acid-binding protein
MKEFVLDANAVISYLLAGESQNAIRVDRLVDLAESGQASLFISAINLGETFYILRKTHSEQDTHKLIAKLTGVLAVVEIDPAAAIRAAEMKYRYKLGYADCFAALLAMDRKAMLVSADPSFEKLGKSLKWLRLDPFRSKS